MAVLPLLCFTPAKTIRDNAFKVLACVTSILPSLQSRYSNSAFGGDALRSGACQGDNLFTDGPGQQPTSLGAACSSCIRNGETSSACCSQCDRYGDLDKEKFLAPADFHCWISATRRASSLQHPTEVSAVRWHQCGQIQGRKHKFCAVKCCEHWSSVTSTISQANQLYQMLNYEAEFCTVCARP